LTKCYSEVFLLFKIIPEIIWKAPSITAMIMQPPSIGKAKLKCSSVECLVGLRSFGVLVSGGFIGSLSFWVGLVALLYTPYVLRGAFTFFYNKLFYLSKNKNSWKLFLHNLFNWKKFKKWFFILFRVACSLIWYKKIFQNIRKSNYKEKSGGFIHNFNADNKSSRISCNNNNNNNNTIIIIKYLRKADFKGCERFMVRLGVKSEYYSNSLRKLRGLTLWNKIWKFFKNFEKVK
jgi:hypothetical protein